MSLLRSAFVMSVAVFLSRILGLVREQVFAYFFGASRVADAFLVAFRIPNLLRDLFAEGALSSAFVSVFSKVEDDQQARQLIRNVVVLLVSALVVIAFGIVVAAPYLVDLLASGFRADPQKWQLTVLLTQIFSPFLLFVSLAALSMGVLNSRGYFFWPAMGSAAFNAVSILVGGGLAWWMSAEGPESAIVGFAWGTLGGALAQWLIQWPLAHKNGFTNTGLNLSLWKEACADPLVHQILKTMAPAILSVAAVQINVMVNTSFAASIGTGSVAWLNYAYRIMHFPMGVFGVALSTAALPRLAALVGQNKQKEFRDNLAQGFSWSLILGVGAASGLYFFAEPIMKLVYERGSFRPEDTVQSARALQAYAVGLLAFNLSKIFTQAYYARSKLLLPGLVSLMAIGTNYVLNLLFVDRYGHVGLALATSLVSWVSVLILAGGLLRSGWHPFKSGQWKLLGSLVLGVLVMGWLAQEGLPKVLIDSRAAGQSVYLLVNFGGLALAGSLFLVPVLLFAPEGRSLTRALLARFRR